MSENSQPGNAADRLKRRLRETRAAREQAQWLESFELATAQRVDERLLLPFTSAAQLHELFYQRLKGGVGVVISDGRAY